MTYDTKTRKENQAIFVRTECSGGVPHIIAYMCWLRQNGVPYQVSDKEGRDFTS